MASPWDDALAAAGSLAAAAAWRHRLATTIRDAAGATVVAVMTCPPGYWLRMQYDTVPARYRPIIDRINAQFVARIAAADEDWRSALRMHGLVYAPLAVAIQRRLADELRTTLLAPEGIDGWLVGYFVASDQRLLGFVVVGTAEPDDVALPRLRAPLTALVGRAASTLEGALALAAGCGMAVPALDDGELPLTARELQIADLAAQGYSNANVAALLELSANTVGVHLRKVYRKLGVHSRVELSAAMQRRR